MITKTEAMNMAYEAQLRRAMEEMDEVNSWMEKVVDKTIREVASNGNSTATINLPFKLTKRKETLINKKFRALGFANPIVQNESIVITW